MQNNIPKPVESLLILARKKQFRVYSLNPRHPVLLFI
jgi:hypothetical protein